MVKNVKNLEDMLHKFVLSGAESDLPDITKDYILKVNSTADGYNSLRKGGHTYVIKKDGSDYSIYRAHFAKQHATPKYTKEPVKVDDLFLDGVPVVVSKGNSIFFEQRDYNSSYDITKHVEERKVKTGENILFLVLQAFLSYAYTVYRFSNYLPSNLVPPVEVVTKPADNNAGGSNDSGTPDAGNNASGNTGENTVPDAGKAGNSGTPQA